MTCLRELTDHDAPTVRRIFNDVSVRFLDRAAMGVAESVAYVTQARAWSVERPRRRYVLGIDVGGDLVGVVKLSVTTGEGRIGYVLRQDSWGHGHATRAVRELVTLAFGAWGLATVRAQHRSANPASGRVLAKAGFLRTGTVGGFVRYVATREEAH
ncbi:GNAT family N-acetyltransferase [Streptomyces odonnellii]|uniref:GNAT family N-acetyltransferase n=1 Tax=Streptomyces odonnellii TaxID=1417980 RepID=UPI000624F4D1|nr:GNAT family N-acetyltransferase [Streptomyces odonnellii]